MTPRDAAFWRSTRISAARTLRILRSKRDWYGVRRFFRMLHIEHPIPTSRELRLALVH